MVDREAEGSDSLEVRDLGRRFLGMLGVVFAGGNMALDGYRDVALWIIANLHCWEILCPNSLA